MFDKLDPYCLVRLAGGGEFRTPVLDNAGNNPVWDFVGELAYDQEEEMEFVVFDKDTMSDDLLGTAVVPMEDFEEGFEGKVVLKLDGKKQPKQEQVLVLRIEWPDLGFGPPK